VSDTPEEKKGPDAITVLFIGALLVGAVAVGIQQARGYPVVEEGTVMPDFTLEKETGGVVQLSALRGKVVVVNFWATWCPPCREEVPYLVKTAQEFAPKGVELVAISNDNIDSQKLAVRGFLKRFPQLEPYVAYGQPETGHAYSVRALPSVFVLDREGRVVASQQGQASERQLRSWIEEALER
jgi:peroxiredoxin